MSPAQPAWGERHPAVLALGGFVAVRAAVLCALLVSADQAGREGHRLLTKWDAQWYAGIAENGYGFVLTHVDGRLLADYAFFPLYPWSERFVAQITGLAPVDAGLAISAVAAVAAATGVFAVGRHLFGSRTAVIATVLWAALPVGIVLSMAYSEALFTAVAAWCLYAVLKEQWLAASALACAAGLSRPAGLAVVAAVTVAAAVSALHDPDRPWGRPRELIADRRVLAVICAPLGLLGYLGWVGWQLGTPTGYFEVARGWGNSLDGGARFARWTIGLVSGPAPVLGALVILGIGLVVLLMVLCVRQGQPLPLLVFVAVLVVLAMTTTGYFGSKPRYLLPAFPLLFPVAAWLAAKATPMVVVVLAAASASSAAYAAVWLLGPGPP